MQESLLWDAGLTKNEVKAYLSLLNIGKASSGQIIKDSKISSGKIYETLSKLVDKGLVEVIIEDNVKKFSATNPQSLLLYMQEREQKVTEQTKRIERIIPKLQSLQKTKTKSESVFLIKGFKGIKPIIYSALNQTVSEIKIMGIRSSKDTKFNIFWQHWHNERVKQKKKAKLIFTDRNTKYWKFFKKLKQTKVRSVTEVSPSAIMVVDNNSFIFTYENKEFVCVHSTSKAIAKSFESFFDGLWKIGKA